MRAHDIEMYERTVWDCDLASIHCYYLIAMGSLVYVQNRWDETQLLVDYCSGHGVEEARHVIVVRPLGSGLRANDGIDVGLEMTLFGEVNGEEDNAVVDAVCCCFVPGEEEDEGVTENFSFS